MTNEVERVDWGSKYDERCGQYESLRRVVEESIRQALEDDGIVVHGVSIRLKKRDSFVEKIDRKSYTDPFNQMPDIVGARIVCLFLDDLQKVDESISRVFDVASKEDKTSAAPTHSFRYRSVHYECTIKLDNQGPYYDKVKGLTFEIQVRTILQDAWAVVEHTLGYKNQRSLPDEVERDFGALMGLFHVADKMFQQLRVDSLQSEAAADGAVKAAADLGAVEPGPAHSLTAGLVPEVSSESAYIVLSRLDTVALDRSWLKAMLRHLLPDREGSEDADYSFLVDELWADDITTTTDLLNLYSEYYLPALQAEEGEPPLNKSQEGLWEETQFNDVGLVRMMLRCKFPMPDEMNIGDDYFHGY
ncbi:hypothetical protein AB0H98_26135 [Nocardia salmonicida]|uniref:GTP pyrophosphokinase n=1 Tax=Nocardia salmonicida TaxID=53431 RepID=UPI0033DBD249